MESKNNMPVSRRDFIKKIGLGGAAVLASPLTAMAEKISGAESKNNLKYEHFVLEQVDKIREIIANKKFEEIFSNPYFAYCLYYSREFLGEISNPKNQHYVSEKIMGSVAHLITPEFRSEAILFLEERTKDKESSEDKHISTREISPLGSYHFGEGENHEGAVDLFTSELSPICSMGDGLVIVAENGWQPKDELSTSSINGGNTVIVFNYLTKEFYRYIHLNEVTVNPGELVLEGKNLGTVGHTGKSASVLGHGEHLHLEIRKYSSDKNENILLSTRSLKKRLADLKNK